MASLNFAKVTALPGSLLPNTMYLVAPSGFPNALEVYVSDAAGTASRRTLQRSEVQAMIDAAVAGGTGGAIIVDDIAARDAVTADNAQSVFVVDASADPTVDTGWATYIWRESTSSWIKTGENENLDVVLTWSRLTDGPTSSPAQIDQAVADRHTHSNKTQLDQIGQDTDGNLTYGGSRPLTPLGDEAW